MNHSIKELKEILENHKNWLNSGKGKPANLRGANLRGANLRDANLRDANLRNANLRDANLMNVNLMDANLMYADLKGADLRGANLRWANLMYADLKGADLKGANLRWADLKGANLKGANLKGADLRNTNGNLKEIKSIRIETYHITYTKTTMYIGCETHSIKDWFEFDDKRILEMDGKPALIFWRKWKPILQQIILVE